MKENIIGSKTFMFALTIINLCKHLRQKREYEIASQLLRCGTSIGANVAEAGAGQTKKDFFTKMCIASKEARETKYWLDLLDISNLVKYDYSNIKKDIEEIINIITAITRTTKLNLQK